MSRSTGGFGVRRGFVAAAASLLLFASGCCCPKKPCCPSGPGPIAPGGPGGQGPTVGGPTEPGGKFVKIKIINTTTTWTVKKTVPPPQVPSTYAFHYDTNDVEPWCDQVTSTGVILIPGDVPKSITAEFPPNPPNRWACASGGSSFTITLTLVRPKPGGGAEFRTLTTACSTSGFLEATVTVGPGEAQGETEPTIAITCQ